MRNWGITRRKLRRWTAATACLLIGTVALPIGTAGAAKLHKPSASKSARSKSKGSKYNIKTPQSELSALRRARWMTNVSVSLGKGAWTFKSTGVPPTSFIATDYAVPSDPTAVSAAGARVIATSTILADQSYDYKLPLTPAYTSKTTTTNQGPIGIALDGAVFYNPYEQNHTTVATTDNFVATSSGVTASFLDNCDGHPGPGGQYHYHGLPACLGDYATGQSFAVGPVASMDGTTTAAVSLDAASARKPVLLGFAFDGYGIYDNIAMNGSTIPPSSLDVCNGIFSVVPGYPHGVYHYVLENIKGAQADIGCYHGVVSSAYTQALRNVLGAGNGGSGGGAAGGVRPGGGGAPNGGPPNGGPPNGGPPNGGPPPGGPPRANTGQAPETAYSLAANTAEDNLLRAVLAVSPNRDC